MPQIHELTVAQHTGIGLISLLIAQLERHPHEPYLNPQSPLVTLTSCGADFAPDIPGKLKRAIRDVEASLAPKKGKKHQRIDKKALKVVQDWWVKGSTEDGTLPPGVGKAMVSTTQAVDIINGGVKVNALVRFRISSQAPDAYMQPEVVTAIVNHRISLASSVGELQEHLAKTLKPIASRYNLQLEAFGKDIELEGCAVHLAKPKLGKVVISEAFHSS